MSINLPEFKSFDVSIEPTSLGITWSKWLKRLENLFTAIEVNDDGRKKALVLHYAGEDVNEIYETLVDATGTFSSAKEALNTYFNASTNFSGARTGTAKAAQDLYGSDAKLAVETAWCAVGVGSCPTATISLTNNGKLTNISANKGVEYSYTLEVPAGATDLVFTTTGSTGDADLFVKFGSAASASVNDCKSTTATSNEVCRIANVQAGTYHVTLQAYSQISGVSLVGRYTEKVVSTLKPIDVSATNISVPNKAWKRFTYKIEAGYANLTIAISGGTGDVDLYVTYGKQSTLTSSDCAPYLQGNNETCKFNNPDAGTWYIDMYGYQAAYGVKISLTATP